MKTFILMIAVTVCFSLGLFAQTNGKGKQTLSTENTCKYGDENLAGENMDLNVVNTDIREILTYVTEQFG